MGCAFESSALLGKHFVAQLFMMIVIAWGLPGLAWIIISIAWFVIFLNFLAQIFQFDLLFEQAYPLLQSVIIYGAYLAFDIAPSQFFMAIFLAIFMDVFAYLGGRTFGRHKNIIMASPNKSLEGFVIGFVASLAFGISIGFLAWQAALMAVMAMAGDAWASGIKRQANVKDSGYILPGHGGILDRADSWLPCLFLVCLF
ncbi:phosphatidate cytidylyltransferase [Gammaproteobacteria bacterium]|nr:phosphatidate cytidylyltransferase [Gammaproteobacteria bacterium]